MTDLSLEELSIFEGSTKSTPELADNLIQWIGVPLGLSADTLNDTLQDPTLSMTNMLTAIETAAVAWERQDLRPTRANILDVYHSAVMLRRPKSQGEVDMVVKSLREVLRGQRAEQEVPAAKRKRIVGADDVPISVTVNENEPTAVVETRPSRKRKVPEDEGMRPTQESRPNPAIARAEGQAAAQAAVADILAQAESRIDSRAAAQAAVDDVLAQAESRIDARAAAQAAVSDVLARVESRVDARAAAQSAVSDVLARVESRVDARADARAAIAASMAAEEAAYPVPVPVPPPSAAPDRFRRLNIAATVPLPPDQPAQLTFAQKLVRTPPPPGKEYRNSDKFRRALANTGEDPGCLVKSAATTYDRKLGMMRPKYKPGPKKGDRGPAQQAARARMVMVNAMRNGQRFSVDELMAAGIKREKAEVLARDGLPPRRPPPKGKRPNRTQADRKAEALKLMASSACAAATTAVYNQRLAKEGKLNILTEARQLAKNKAVAEGRETVKQALEVREAKKALSMARIAKRSSRKGKTSVEELLRRMFSS
jgi:hypothetical protein